MIQIVDTGVANIRSLQAAFDRLGHTWNLTQDKNEIEHATHVVLPGVGAIAAAAETIDRLGLRKVLTDRINDPESATLCICLGMQMLFDSSEESGTAKGLGVISATIQRFPDDIPVPQLGWNQVRPTRADGWGGVLYESGEAYFANSFRLVETPPNDWGFATTDYGGSFVSSLWRGRTLACQFHPELSGAWGQAVLNCWVVNQTMKWSSGPEGSIEC